MPATPKYGGYNNEILQPQRLSAAAFFVFDKSFRGLKKDYKKC